MRVKFLYDVPHTSQVTLCRGRQKFFRDFPLADRVISAIDMRSFILTHNMARPPHRHNQTRTARRHPGEDPE